MAQCKNCGKELSGRWKNFCSRRCGGFYYIRTHAKETGIEKKMREWLETSGLVFKTQVPIKNITLVDFVLGDKLCVYCDGTYWHSLPKRKYYDDRINKRLEKLGYTVLRFDEQVINKDFNKVAETICQHIQEVSKDYSG